jgi:sulfate permease, SulP family
MAVVLSCQSISFIDSQGAWKLGEIADLLRTAGVDFRLARVKPRVMAVLARDGLIERIGEDHVYLDVDDAVAALHPGEKEPSA